MNTDRMTKFGYVAVAKGQSHLMRQPRVSAEIPIRVSAGLGFVYFMSSLLLLQAGGVAEEHALSILGIVAALIVFVYRTVQQVAAWQYSRKLRQYEQQGKLVFVPIGLLQHAQAIHQKLGQTMPTTAFDADLQRTSELVALYKQDNLSPRVKKTLEKVLAV